MGCGTSAPAHVIGAQETKNQQKSKSTAANASPRQGNLREPQFDPTNPKSSNYAERRFSSGGESDYESDSSGGKVHRKSASAECFDLHSIRATVRADGNLNGNVVRMETPFGKPIEEIYNDVHSGRVLGSGVSGIVRLVTHKMTGVKYAVKCLDLGLITNAEGLQQLRQEIYIMCQLDHPNIVRLEEVYESASEIYLVLELCTGGDLFDRLDGQPDLHYTEAKCAKLVKQMLSAVRYLHSKKVIHRDLKLENFLFSSDGNDSVLKMIDFGLSKHFTFGESLTDAVGTPYSVAPEVIKGSYDEKCDIWAVGVITYLLLSGETPFGGVDGENLLQVRDNILRGEVHFRPKFLWANVSDLAKEFVRAALSKDPASRPTAKEAQRHKWIQTYSKLPKDDPGSKLNPDVVQALVGFKEYSDMRKLLCEVLSFTLLPEQINDLRVEFEKIDNGKGEISLTDLKKVLLESARSVGGMTEQEVEDVFNALRVRKTETKIRWHEFIAAGLSQCKVDERNLKLAFDRIDSDRKGYITFENVIELVGGASENNAELKLMWMESIKHIEGDLDRITVDDFLLIMKGQALGQSSESFRMESRRISVRTLDVVREGEASPRVGRTITDFERFEVSTSGQNDSMIPFLTLGDSAEGVAIKSRRSPTQDTQTDRPNMQKLRSRSLEHNKGKYFEGVDEDHEEEVGEYPGSPARTGFSVPHWNKHAIHTVIEDETKTPLMVNRAIYRSRRELRLAVMECSKRFEENQRRRQMEMKLQEGIENQFGPGIALVMRRGSTNPYKAEHGKEQLEDPVVADQESLKKSIEEEAFNNASTRAGRPRRNRNKTVSDMTGMFAPPSTSPL